MEGRRGAFYEHAGALRDVMQTRPPVVGLVAMEPPATLTARDVKDAKLQCAQPGAPDRRHRGVAWSGPSNGRNNRQRVGRGYREEDGVASDSATETYVALRGRGQLAMVGRSFLSDRQVHGATGYRNRGPLQEAAAELFRPGRVRGRTFAT